MQKVIALTAVLALLGLGISTQAAITIDTVTVGNPGNAADSPSHSGNPNGQGSVSYTYNIGKYELTAGQYCAFLNAVAKTDTHGLYNMRMDRAVDDNGCNIKRTGPSGSYSYSVTVDSENRPVNFASFYDACRFANWLHNGQPMGGQDATTTERGTYTLEGHNIQRNANWKWAVTSQDEWYKAAYHKGGGTNAGYWLYPTQSDSIDEGWANYAWSQQYTTVAGLYACASAYGTFDQGGNVWEWIEAPLTTDVSGLRGGSLCNLDDVLRSTAFSDYFNPSVEGHNIGFRLSQVVPEPSSLLILGTGILALAGIVRRRC